MRAISVDRKSVTLQLTPDELLVVNNALAAVCHGVRVAPGEFPDLVGGTRDEGLAFLREVKSAIAQLDAAGAFLGDGSGQAAEQSAREGRPVKLPL
jgi:hypothetical protein